MAEPTISEEEAAVVLREVNITGMPIPLEDFRQGLEVELEHGLRYDDANVTNNHPILTGMIVIAHLKETMDYYQRLEVVELEGDLLKAIISRDLPKIESKYGKLTEARTLLDKVIAEQLK